MTASAIPCDHEFFESSVVVHRTELSRFMARVKIKCGQCGEEFEFFGLERDVVNLNGATVSSDGTAAYIAVGTKRTIEQYYRESAESFTKKRNVRIRVPVVQPMVSI